MNEVKQPFYEWRSKLGGLFNSGQTRSVILSGDITGLFYTAPNEAHPLHPNGQYLYLTQHLAREWGEDPAKNTSVIVVEVDGTIRFPNSQDAPLLERAWNTEFGVSDRQQKIDRLINPHDPKDKDLLESVSFQSMLQSIKGNPATAFEFLQELCRISRESRRGDALYKHRLVVLIEDAHILLPEKPIADLSPAYQNRITKLRNWFRDAEFEEGNDWIILLSESAKQINGAISRLPQVLNCEIELPNYEQRLHFIDWFDRTYKPDQPLEMWSTKEDFALSSAALDIHALRQILRDATYTRRRIEPRDVIERVKRHIYAYLGGDGGEKVVEFHAKHHGVADCVGTSKKELAFTKEIMRRLCSTGPDRLSSIIVDGPIGGGKTFKMEGWAGDLGIPVLIIKAIRSKWFGETAIILARLKRVLLALGRVAFFIDEADTKFGGVNAETHETERQLTGELQEWMSDPRMAGVLWILMTARIWQLSPDIRRKGRGGNLIWGVFDPHGNERDEVLEWMIKPSVAKLPTRKSVSFQKLREATDGWSMADYGHMRTELIAISNGTPLTQAQALERIDDELPGDIAEEREYQTLQALLNSSRKSLVPEQYLVEGFTFPQLRLRWKERIRELEAMGIS